MGDAKIDLKLGAIEFIAEGEQVWIAEQLQIVLQKAPDLCRLAPPKLESQDPGGAASSAAHGKKADGSKALAAFLKEVATKNQVQRFLAVAAWLTRYQGRDTMQTVDVTRALGANKQGRLANASVCLTRNKEYGYCIPQGDGFYVAPEGFTSLGLEP